MLTNLLPAGTQGGQTLTTNYPRLFLDALGGAQCKYATRHSMMLTYALDLRQGRCTPPIIHHPCYKIQAMKQAKSWRWHNWKWEQLCPGLQPPALCTCCCAGSVLYLHGQRLLRFPAPCHAPLLPADLYRVSIKGRNFQADPAATCQRLPRQRCRKRRALSWQTRPLWQRRDLFTGPSQHPG